MRELSLFTGAGGGLLGTKLLGWEPIGYVEWNEYCQQVIAARIGDGYLPAAPIFTDVREFAQSGAADQYRGFADVVTAGFPCQPFSIAGKRKAADDERNMWPATSEVIRRVQPRSVLLENVPGLVSCGYIGTVISDLAEMGYVGRWGVIGAADAGAPHKRDRLWIVAHASREQRHASGDNSGDSMGGKPLSKSGNGSRPPQVAHANSAQRERVCSSVGVQPEHAHACGASVGWWRADPADVPESGVDRMVDGLADGMDRRLEAIGNGQVPAVVALAWSTMSGMVAA